MYASRTLLSLLVAALALCSVGAPAAWGWGVEAQRTLPGVTNADRAVVDSNGDIYLLDQFNPRAGSRPYSQRYDVRVVRVSPDLATVDTSLPRTTSEGLARYADPIDTNYSFADLTPSGMAIDRGLRRIYVTTGDGVASLALTGTPSWQVFASGGWFDRGVLAGSVAVSPTTHRVYVADYGANFVCLLAPFDCGEPTPTGPVRIREYSSDGTLLGTLPVPDSCADGSDLDACPIGSFAQFPAASYFAYGPTGLSLATDDAGERLVAIGVERTGTGASVERTALTELDPATGSRTGGFGSGVGTRPMGVIDGSESPTAQSLEAVPLREDTYLLPEVGQSPGSAGLLNVSRDGLVLSRIMERGTGSCALASRNARLAEVPGTDPRAVVVEDVTPVRVTLLRKDGSGCLERPVGVREKPEWASIPFAVSGDATGGDPVTKSVADGGTVAVPIPRRPDGTIQTRESDYKLGYPAPIVDPDNGRANKGPWGTCTFEAPGFIPQVSRLGVDAADGCEGDLALPPLSFVRPLPVTLTVRDDDGDVTAWTVRVTSDDALRADFVTRADETESGRFEFVMDRTCEVEACAGLEDFRQLSLGPIDTWEMDFGDGSKASGDWRNIDEPVVHEYEGDGTFEAKLTLRADGQAPVDVKKSITVDRGDTSTPIAELTASPASVTQGTPITFTPRNTGTGTVASWTLSFDDGVETTGTVADLLPVTHTYRTTGSFTARLSIQLTNGKSASTTQTVTVTEPEKQQVPGQVAIKSCLTPFGIPLGLLGLGDETLCSADPCDLDLAQLGLTNMGIQRPARCDTAPAGTELEGAGEAVAPLGARGRIASSRLTLARDGRIAIRVRCVPGAGACAGSITLDLRPAAGGSRRLGLARFSRLPVGATRTLRIPPSAAARTALATEIGRRLRRGQRAKVRLKISPSATPASITRPSASTAAATISASRATVRALTRKPASKRRRQT